MGESEYPLMAKWAALLKENNLVYNIDTTWSKIILGFNFDPYTFRTDINFNEDSKRVLLSVKIQRVCPKQYFKEMMKLITRINNKLIIGFMTLDPNDGEITLQHGVFLADAEYNKEFVHNFVYTVTKTAQAFVDPITAVCDGMSYTYAKALIK